MTEARDRWSDENGFWVVDDEYGDEWEVITTGNRAMLVQREDGQRYYGAVWVGGDGVGELHPRSAGDVEDGYDCNQRYEFSETHGWEMLDQQDEEGEGETVTTTLEIGGRAFELTDETSRLVAADALQEAGRETEAGWLRSRAFAGVVTLGGRQVVTPFGPELVARVEAESVVRCFSVEATDDARFDAWREVSGDLAAESGDGWYVLPRSDSDADVRALEAALDASDAVTAFEEVYLFAEVSSHTPHEIDRQLTREMDSEFTRVSGTYEPHWVMPTRDGWAGVFERVAAEWLAGELGNADGEGGAG